MEVPAPITGLNSSNVYNSDATAIAAVTSFYTTMEGGGSISSNALALSVLPELSADNLSVISGALVTYEAYYTNNLNSNNNTGVEFWNLFYPLIFDANAAIAGLQASGSLTPAVRQQLIGEAEFVRAFSYYYLVSLYGDVPLVTGTDYKINASMGRTAAKTVWQQVIADLKDAQNKLSANYLDGTLLTTTTEKVRPTKWAAAALLARAYLYVGDYADAQAEASLVISNNNFSLCPLSGPGSVFLRNSAEAIWQLQPVATGANTLDAMAFVIPATGPSLVSFPLYINPTLINSFEAGDQRFVNWIGSVTTGGKTYYYPYKYKVSTYGAPVTEYEMVFRLGEQYLIRAEAEANNNDPADAVTDLNTIRTRAGLPNYAGGTDNASLETAILKERRVELFTEWGSRWLDIKRTGTVNTVMGAAYPQKVPGGVWNPQWSLYPLPVNDLKTDPNLTQNPGY